MKTWHDVLTTSTITMPLIIIILIIIIIIIIILIIIIIIKIITIIIIKIITTITWSSVKSLTMQRNFILFLTSPMSIMAEKRFFPSIHEPMHWNLISGRLTKHRLWVQGRVNYPRPEVGVEASFIPSLISQPQSTALTLTDGRDHVLALAEIHREDLVVHVDRARLLTGHHGRLGTRTDAAPALVDFVGEGERALPSCFAVHRLYLGSWQVMVMVVYWTGGDHICFKR